MRMHSRDKALDWHLGDIEQRLGFHGGKYTDVNPWCALALSLALAGAFFLALCYLPAPWRATKAIAILLDRGWTPYAMVGLFLLAMVTLLLKWRKLAFQRRAFGITLIPVGTNFALTPESAQEVLKTLNEQVDDPKRFTLFNRIERALLNLRNVGNLSDVSEMLRAQAENDESQMESSYGVLAGIVWVVPILGFIGTVIGLSGAIGGFGAVLNTDATVTSLKESLAPVTGSLSIAFDTTFLALVLAMAIQLAVTLLRKQEEAFLDACRDYVHVNLISRLKLISRQDQ